MPRSDLAAAFEATSYRCGDVSLRVGARVPEALARLLARRDARAWAWLTAVNPGAKVRDAATDRAAMRDLATALRTRGTPYLEGVAIADDGGWPEEPSFLVVGIDEHEARALAEAFGQAAFLAGGRDGAVRLCWTRP